MGRFVPITPSKRLGAELAQRGIMPGLRHFVAAGVPTGHQRQHVMPEGIDFHRFAATGGDGPVIHAGIHPGQRGVCFRGQEAVRR